MAVLSRQGDTLVIDPDACDAVVFDMDGVLTHTAKIHARAWKETFDGFLATRSGGEGADLSPFDIQDDYRRYVDGKPRYEGVRSFLSARGIEIEEGEPDDPPESSTVRGLGNRKNQRFLALLREEGAKRWDDGIALVRALREAKVRTAVFSASRNAREVLESAGITDLFEACVDGVVAAETGLSGKPAPDVPVEAARRLDAVPERCAIVEDSIAGVQAGRRGGFGAVIGVARSGDPERLRAAGADVVVRDLSEVTVADSGERGRPIDAIPDALEHMDAVADRIAGRETALFLDFDGTLAPIVDHPERAALPDETRALLGKLAGRRTVAVVSGRDLDDLVPRVGLEDVYYAGSHGFRLAGPGGFRREYEHAGDFLPALDAAEERLHEALDAREGVEVERKRYAVAVHYRRAPADAVDGVRSAVEAVQKRSGGALRVSEGRKVLELRPAIDWHKGRAVRFILDALDLDGEAVCPVYVGDDVTDEDAFAAVAGDGLSVVVRGRADGRSRAAFALPGPEAVATFLARLDERCGAS